MQDEGGCRQGQRRGAAACKARAAQPEAGAGGGRGAGAAKGAYLQKPSAMPLLVSLGNMPSAARMAGLPAAGLVLGMAYTQQRPAAAGRGRRGGAGRGERGQEAAGLAGGRA